MPLYEYQCQQCSDTVEILQRMSDPPQAHCAKCGGEMKKLISAPAIQFKGSGFYKTDYPTSSSRSTDSASKGDSSAKSDSGSKSEGSSSGSDSGAKSDAGAKSESKSESGSESESKSTKSESKAE
jgi:putative FmdB family regulatory protein